MLRSCAVVVWTMCLLATAWGRYLNEYDYSMMQDVETETTTQPIENGETGSQQAQQMGYAYGNQQQMGYAYGNQQQTTTTSSELPPTSAPTQMLDIPMLSDNNYNQYSGYGSGYGEEYNSGASGEESGSGLIGFDSLPGNEEGSGEGSGSFSPSDCSNLADGNYIMSACGHQFLVCSDGLPHVMDCPAGLVYDAKFNMCDWPHNLGCEGEIGSGEPVAEESGSGAASGEESGEESSGEESGLIPVEQPTTTTLPVTTSTAQTIQESTTESSGAASGEESGEFSGEESSGEESGLTPVEQQPATTTTSTAQTSQESTTESSGLELAPSTSTAEPETSGIEETTPLAEGSSSTEAEAELSGEEGSAELLGESQLTTTTAISSTSSTTTPAVTDEAELSGEEGSAEETEEGQQQTTTAMPTSTSTQSDSTIISIVVRRNQLDEALRSQSGDCSARADGNYQLARCSDRFLSCSNGIGHLMNCPDQLVFNAQINACDFPSALMCDENSAGGTGVESDTLCSSDGVFATESCSPNFHNCINGKLFDLSCDPGQLFSWARELCLPVTEFPECDLH